jgi:hypothetical protein
VKRRVFTIIAAVSLLLCIAEAVWWIQSYWYYDSVIRKSLDRDVYSIGSSAGEVYLKHSPNNNGIAPEGRISFWRHKPAVIFQVQPPAISSPDHVVKRDIQWLHGGFGYFSQAVYTQYDRLIYGSTVVVFPHWLVFLLLNVLPVWWFLSRRKSSPDHCQTCGYDLRATPERCPECGTVRVVQ